MSRRLPRLASAALLSLIATHARAEEGPRHAGIYLRADGGLGSLAVSSSSVSRANRTFRGTTFSWAAFLGGTLAPACAGGGALSLDHVYGLSAYDQATGPVDVSDVTLYHRMLGPFLNCYFDPQGGAHVWAIVGPAKLSISRDGQPASAQIDPTPDPSGLGFQLGVGYDAWIGSGTSLGIAIRFTYSPLTADEIGSEVDVKVAIPALLLTLTAN